MFETPLTNTGFFLDGLESTSISVYLTGMTDEESKTAAKLIVDSKVHS